MSHQVYLDNNATTCVLDSVKEVVSHVMQDSFGNPSSSHIAGLRAKHIVNTSRDNAKKVIGAETGEVIFTSGATEGIQTAIVSALVAARDKIQSNPAKPYYLLYGATEHKAVPNTMIHWNKVLGVNAEIKAIPVDKRGILDCDFIAEHAADSLLICTMAVNNETGVYQDLALLEQVIRKANQEVFWMVDCVQALGKTELSISQTTIDYAPFSGHKLYTPKGIGVLYVREGAPLSPFIAGGGQEGGVRSGTENTPGIAAFGKICQLLLDKDDDTFKSDEVLLSYRQQLADTLKEVFPAIVFNHDFACSVPTTINFSVKGLSSKEIMDLFDAASIRVSAGSACSSKTTRSFVLDAMGAESWQSESAIRLSFGPADSQAQVDEYCAALRSLIPALRHSCMILSDAREEDDTKFQTGLLQLNSDNCVCWIYIDADTRECVIIDPLANLCERIERWVRCQDLKVMMVLDTHVHVDRENYSHVLRASLADRMVSDFADVDAMGWPVNVNSQVEVASQQLPYVAVGGYKVARVSTPGHTDESMSLLLVDEQNQVDIALVGDLLIPGGFGRTDGSDGCSDAFYHSLLTLVRLITPQTLIGSSHDYKHHLLTNLSIECRTNELLDQVVNQHMNQTEFNQAKQALDQRLQHEQSDYLCGLVELGDEPKPYSLTADDIDDFVATHPDAQLLDLRESYESDMETLTQTLNLRQPAINVPLSKLAQYVIEHGRSKEPMLLVCRSGNRSSLACKALERLGFDKVYNIAGGVALFHAGI